jgi:lipoprotein-anchoring transpeptidase ErfK/SrfK
MLDILLGSFKKAYPRTGTDATMWHSLVDRRGVAFAPRFLAIVLVTAALTAFHNAAKAGPFDPATQPPDVTQAGLPADADPYYSTPGDFDRNVDMKATTRAIVADPTRQEAGTLTIDTEKRKLFLSLGDGQAIAYRIGVGRQGFAWKGIAEIGRKAYWPGWTPPPEMLERQPELPAHVDGGLDNPLGARALYLFEDHKDTLFRIHGTNDPKSIGKAVSSGCIRMLNADVIDLYQWVVKGARVVVL